MEVNRWASVRRRRAALLLEVVVALTIMVAAMGVLGAQLVSGLRMTGAMDRVTRATAFVDRLLALVELDPEIQEMLQVEEETDGDFGEQYPGWYWRIESEPIPDVEGLGQVRVEVYYQEDPALHGTLQGGTMIRRVVLLKAVPGRINLVEDFGVNEEQLAEFEALLPVAEFDPTNVDPQQLVALLTENPELLAGLLEMAPALLPLFQQFGGAEGGGMGDLAALQEQLSGFEGGDQLGEELEQFLMGGGGGGRGGRPGPEVLGRGPGGGRGRNAGRGGQEVAGGGRPRGGNVRGGDRGGVRPQPGGGSGAGGDYTIEDLIRMRDEWERQQGGR